MNELIHIQQTQIGLEKLNSANSRDIYSYLGISTRYNDWILRAIEKYDFEENVDYSKMSSENSKAIDYIVTLDMAKELCMVSNTSKGKETRKYFISIEKSAKNALALPDFTNPAIAARAWADEVEAKLALEHKIVEKDEIILAVADLNIKAGDVSFADFAKNLALENMGRNNVIKFCKAKSYLQLNTAPYQPYVNRGYFVRKPSREKINGETRYTTYLTSRGSVWLAKVIRAEYDLD